MKSAAAKKKHAGVFGFLLVALILLVGVASVEAARSIPKLMDSERTQAPIGLSSRFEVSPTSSENRFHVFPWLISRRRCSSLVGSRDQCSLRPPRFRNELPALLTDN